MKQQLTEVRTELAQELVSILDYWQRHTIDEEQGGFYGHIDHFNIVNPRASKGAVLNARILWTFSAAYNFSGERAYLETADRAFDYLRNHFLDQSNGGLFWELDHLGRPLNTRKQTYAQGFGVYGFSEYYRASRKKEGLDLAVGLFEDIEKHCFDKAMEGYIEALTEDWQMMDDMRLSEKDANYPKSMNTHLHILEPYTNLYRVWKSDQLKRQIIALIRTFLDHIIDTESAHFKLFFENDWTSRSDIISYGHDIEGAWLLTEAAEVVGNRDLLREVEQIALRMTEVTIEEGAAGDGSIYYERESANGHLDTDKHWWPQAEAMVGFLNAHQISGDSKYLEYAKASWNFIQEYLIDQEKGEWFWRVDIDGNPYQEDEKAGFWKCPYHNSRSCIEAIQRIDEIVK